MREAVKVLVVLPPSEVDVATAPEFAQAVQTALEQFPDLLVVDFADVQFVGAAGIEVLTYAKDVVDSYGARLAVRNASPHLHRLLKLSPAFANDPIPSDEAHGRE